MSIHRRTFLKTVGSGAVGAAAVAVANGCRSVLPEPAEALETFQPSAERPYPGAVRWIPSVCLQCPSGCGILVKVVEGKAVKVEGNPLHPMNQGGICPKGQAMLQSLYSPLRIRQPMKRIGGRNSVQWQAITLDEAIALLCEKLASIRSTNPHSLVLWTERCQGLMLRMWERFFEAFGSPNCLSADSHDTEMRANEFMLGRRSYGSYDWDRVKYLLSFESDFLEEGRLVGRMHRAHGQMKQWSSRAKIVQFGSRLSVTAAKADEWIPVNPGTSGALALGIAYVLIEGGLYNGNFVKEWTFGFEDWKEGRNEHQGFKTLVLRDYTPEKVAQVTGVPPETIRRISREFAIAQPGVAIGGSGIAHQTNGLYSQMAVNALNALVGNLERYGGVLTQQSPPFAAPPSLKKDRISRRGLSQARIDGVSQGIVIRKPYPAEVLLLYNANPCYTSTRLNELRRALEASEEPFIVSFSSWWDDSTEYADMLLPDHTCLEKWQDGVIVSGDGFPAFGIAQPAVSPIHETMDTGDVILQIARRLGGSVAQSFPWESFQVALMHAVEGVYRVNQGSIGGYSFKSSFEEFWDELLLQGVWFDQPYHFGKLKWEEVFQTPSGKFEFYSQLMKRQISSTSVGTQLDNNDEMFLPHHAPPRFAGEQNIFPLHLQLFQTLPLSDTPWPNQPWLLEIAGLHLNAAWETWVEINPRTAQDLGIVDGDLVWVESPFGRMKARARLYQGAMPNVVCVPLGLGHRIRLDDWSSSGENPYSILADEFDAISGRAALGATRVRVYKA